MKNGEAKRIRSLHIIKSVHTIVWAAFVACIAAIWWFAWHGALANAGLAVGIVTLEALILLLNGWRCPLTAMAARYTDDRRDNFDIYLPLWLARHNKTIFGGLYVAGSLFTCLSWLQMTS